MKRWWNYNHGAAVLLFVAPALLLASVGSRIAPPRMLFGRRSRS